MTFLSRSLKWSKTAFTTAGILYSVGDHSLIKSRKPGGSNCRYSNNTISYTWGFNLQSSDRGRYALTDRSCWTLTNLKTSSSHRDLSFPNACRHSLPASSYCLSDSRWSKYRLKKESTLQFRVCPKVFEIEHLTEQRWPTSICLRVRL